MRGVIIWHCKETEQAVVWCEDSTELAYAGGKAAWANAGTLVEVGDCVAFDLQPFTAARSCKNIRVLERSMAPELANILNKMKLGPVGVNLPQTEERPTAQVSRPAGRTLYAVGA